MEASGAASSSKLAKAYATIEVLTEALNTAHAQIEAHIKEIQQLREAVKRVESEKLSSNAEVTAALSRQMRLIDTLKKQRAHVSFKL